MKRRSLLQVAAAIPAAAQAPQGQRPAAAELPKLETSTAEAAAEPVPRFFSAAQMAALRKLCGILMPPLKGSPGALDARVPEFLDFWIGESPADRQNLYKTGLDLLNAKGPFAALDPTQTAALRAPWTYDPPKDPLAAFLRAAKQDVRTATMNSKEYSAVAAAGGGGRRGFGGGLGLYWYSLD